MPSMCRSAHVGTNALHFIYVYLKPACRSDEKLVSREVMTEIYRLLYLNQLPILFTSRRTAELTKYAANAFLATKITFINEIADLCEKAGADVQDVARGIGLDNRNGGKFLHAGPGYGGSCFPKDTLALIKTAQNCEAPMRIVETVVAVNEARKRGMAGRVIAACGGSVAGKKIAILGLAFKPNTDDMRDAPSLDIVAALAAAGAHVKAHDPQSHDPQSMEQARALMPEVEYCSDAYLCAPGADALVIVTETARCRRRFPRRPEPPAATAKELHSADKSPCRVGDGPATP